MILDLADIRQESDYACGEAAVRIVLRFFGMRFPVPQLATREHGTHPAQIQQALILAGLRTSSGAFRVSQLQAFAEDLSPVICAVRDDEGNGHWVVVRGVRYGKVHYQCPTTGVRTRRVAEWLEQWHDVGMFGDRFDDFGIAAWKP